ncbi:MAG: putative baseplate protein J [Prokaryotic dsDNA virus sp.]|mgnify:CR=1 FL=1|nr:MAG: putative baseplate protein J [Prokaryotic dsDNA virus sp.]
MALNFETYATLSGQGRAELRRRIPEVDPTVFGSFARPMIDSASALAYSNQLKIRDLSFQLFPQFAGGVYLERWGDYEDLTRNPASSAEGNLSIPGTNGTVIPALTIFNGSNGLEYETSAVAVIQNVSQAISSITRSGTTATATMAADHSLASNLEVTISGADQAEYNGTFSITVTARDQFTFQISGSPATPATGTISYTSTYANANVSCTTTGSSTNLDAGSVLNLSSAITGADGTGTAQFDGISGGSDIETDDEYRARILLSRSIIEGVFTADQVKLAALGVAGNTRAFVVTPTLSVADPAPSPGSAPAPGQVFVYVLRDGDANIIPTATVLANTKQAIIDNGAMPANTSEADVFVFAPTPVEVDFTFTSITPDTPTMRTAIENQLQAFFDDSVDFEDDVTEADYLGAINNTVDTTTGTEIDSFSLSAPSGTISISSGEIAVLGTVSF